MTPRKRELVRYLTVIGMLALLLFAVGCEQQKNSTRTETSIDSAGRPDAEVKGARISLYDKGRVTTEIHAQKLLKFEAKDSTMGYVVDADFFDSLGQKISTLVGDSSLTRENSGHLWVYGNVVVVVLENNTRLETDYLHWNPDIKKIQTDAFVKITKNGDVVTGWGMEADQKLTRIKILKQVSGSFHDTTGLNGL